MKRIVRAEALEYAFDAGLPARLEVDPGESFAIETEDAASGYLRNSDVLPTPDNRPTHRSTPPKVNPIGGPVFVRGAEPGDLLAVTIEKIAVQAQGFTVLTPSHGALAGLARWSELGEHETFIFTHHIGPSGTLADGTVRFTDRLQWPLRPMIGTIGTAPEWLVEPTGEGQGPWGGNLDVQDMAPPNVVYLNCYHPGGLFFLGDVHASQGDTEFTGTANETRAEVTCSCQVVKGKRIPFPRIEKPESVVALSCARPLEDAVVGAVENLLSWMVDDYGLEAREAYLMTSVNPDFRINVYQMADVGRLRYTVGAEIPKRYLA